MNSISLLQLIIFVSTITVTGALWDLWATRHGKKDPFWIWAFNPKDTLGVQLLGVPIEEYFFYIFSSIYIVFMWKGIELGFYFLIPALGVWTFIALLVPYKMSPQNDKLIG